MARLGTSFTPTNFAIDLKFTLPKRQKQNSFKYVQWNVDGPKPGPTWPRIHNNSLSNIDLSAINEAFSNSL